MEAKYKFYEVVRVTPKFTSSENVAGLEGAVLGLSQDENNEWYYAVHLYKLGKTWMFSEKDLESTGKMDRRESFYDGTSITVVVDPDTGEGKVTEYHEPYSAEEK